MLLFIKTTTITIPNSTVANYYINKLREKYEWGGGKIEIKFDRKNNVYYVSYDTIIDSMDKEFQTK